MALALTCLMKAASTMNTLIENSFTCSSPVMHELRRLTEIFEAELSDEAHPHSKIADRNNNSHKLEKRGRGRPPTHGLSRTPIYTSYREAKRRCTDPRHRDYERYGGRGIEFRFDAVTDLFSVIGDRPQGKTLDRIDPDGHYEVGNVRWASPKEQANNRCQPQRICISPGWTELAEAREDYLQTARHWVLSVKGLSDPTSLSPEEAEFLTEGHRATGFPDVTFSQIFNEFYAYQGPYTETITLPSLNQPGGRVILSCNPFKQLENSPLAGRGLLEGLVDVPLEVNCPQAEIMLLKRFIEDFRSRRGPPGLRLSGPRVEGRLMAMACHSRCTTSRYACLLAGEIAEHLSHNEMEPLFEDEYLFIPDLQVWPAVFGGEQQLTKGLLTALGTRVDRWLPTITCFDTPGELGQAFELLFSWWYREH